MKANLARLVKDLKKYGITQEAVALACEPPVTRTMACKVLNGVAVSARVVATAVRLIEDAKQNGSRTADDSARTLASA